MATKVRVYKSTLEAALCGLMGMFSWSDAKRLGVTDDDWCEHYAKLERLYNALERGEFRDVVNYDTVTKEESTVTRKDYEKIAAALAKSWIAYGTNLDSKLAVSNVVNNVCDTLKEDNPNFSREMFIARIEQLIAEDKASG